MVSQGKSRGAIYRKEKNKKTRRGLGPRREREGKKERKSKTEDSRYTVY